MKTLVVDDVKVNCRVLQGLLSGYGECDIANDGASAVRLFNQALTGDAPYDLVCLDIMMPDYDGRQVLQALRR